MPTFTTAGIGLSGRAQGFANHFLMKCSPKAEKLIVLLIVLLVSWGAGMPQPDEQDHSQEKDVEEELSDPEAPPLQDKDSPTSVCVTASAVTQAEPMRHTGTEAALDFDQQMCFSTARECSKVGCMDDAVPLFWARTIMRVCFL